MRILLDNLQTEEPGSQATTALANLLSGISKNDLVKNRHELMEAMHGSNVGAQTAALAALMTANPSDEAVTQWLANNKEHQKTYLDAITLLSDPHLQATFYSQVKALSAQWPEQALPLLMKMTIAEPAQTEPIRDFLRTIQKQGGQYEPAAFDKALKNMTNLLATVPVGDRKESQTLLESMGTLEIRLKAVEAKMAFDLKEVHIPAGRRVSLVFENADLMPHNVVITSPGNVQKVGEAADAMAKLKDGFEKHFVPTMPEVLFATPLVDAGKNYRLDFKAPDAPGDYPFICSFPGHWQVMQGVIHITPAANVVQGR